MDSWGLLTAWGLTVEDTDRAALPSPSPPWLGTAAPHDCQALEDSDPQPCPIFPETLTHRPLTTENAWIYGLSCRAVAACSSRRWWAAAVLTLALIEPEPAPPPEASGGAPCLGLCWACPDTQEPSLAVSWGEGTCGGLPGRSGPRGRGWRERADGRASLLRAPRTCS